MATKVTDPLVSEPPPTRVKTVAVDERPLLTGRTRVKPWSGIAVSLLAHVAMFGGALAYARWTPPRVVPETPIVAKLVRLGTPRDEKLLPRLPTAPRPPPPPATGTPTPPLPVPAAAPPTPAAPSPEGTAPAVETPPAPNPGPSDAARQALEDMERRQRMMEALGQVPATGPTTTEPQPVEGRPDGDPAGDAAEAAAGDMYLAIVRKTIKDHYVVPTTISAREKLFLECKVALWIRPDGTVADFRIEESSTNAQFDRAVEAVLQRVTFPPPPKAFLDRFGKSGIGFAFNLK